MSKNKLFLSIVIIAVLIKIFFFAFVTANVPNAKFENDSYDYLNTGMMLASRGVFAQDNNGVLKYELNRTPGYPFFLGLLHGTLKIPLNGIILVQVLLTILAAFVTYKAAFEIDNKITFLAAAIVLFSIPVTVFSLMIMTESLYLFLISLFMLAFIRYLKNRKTKLLVLSAILLATATYVRPISYYLGGALAIFIVYVNIPNKFKKAILHAILFLAVAYGLLGVWQLRNYIHFHQNTFSSIIQSNYKTNGIFHSYLTNKDPLTQGWPLIPYYVNVSWRCFLSLITRPGSFKYLHFPALTIAGKVIGYPWVVFWMSGFLIGLTQIRRNVYYQFILCVILYFVFITIAGDMWCSGERFRVPIVPFIAIISAAGWHMFLVRRVYITARFREELRFCKYVLEDKRTPKLAHLLLLLALVYFFSPIDIIPDFIPGLGELDDIILIPSLVILAYKITPQEVINDCRRKSKEENIKLS